MSMVAGAELAAILEATLLRADATGADVDALCREVLELGIGAAVVLPIWLARARRALGGAAARLVSVAGFPLGGNPSVIKCRETALAFEAGADEVDFVMPIGLVKGGELEPVREEFELLMGEAKSRRKTLKVIVECGLLSDDHVRTACRLAVDAGIPYVKTSTGFGPRGATVEDVRLLRACVGDRAGVKAAGGIRTLAQARALVEAGATRLGTSAARAIIGELEGARTA